MTPVQIDALYSEGWHGGQSTGAARDLAFWADMASRFGSPVLELASGYGRIALSLAEAGYAVTALDISESLIWEARKNAEKRNLRIDWVRGDIRKYKLHGKFPLIILPGSSICHLLTPDDLRLCLECAKNHLAPGGRVILEALSPKAGWLGVGTQEKRHMFTYDDSNWKGAVVVSQACSYDSERQINRLKRFYKFPGREEELVEEVDVRLYCHDEIKETLAGLGLEIHEAYADFCKSPINQDSEKQLLICSAAA